MISITTRTFLACLLAGAATADVPHSVDASAYNAGLLGDAPNQTFHSSAIVAPIFLVNTLDLAGIDPAPYLFLEWRYNNVSSPMIFRSHDLSLVYADQQYVWTKNTRAQVARNETYLTFWEGAEAIRYGNGHCLVLDREYNLKYNITPVGLTSGRLVDLHECQFTKEGNALISVYESVPWDLTPVGGDPEGVLLDNLFQEIDLETGELLFEWRSSDHYGVEGTSSTIANNTLPGGFDYYHINSVEKRHMDPRGEANEFLDLSDGIATGFFAQHQARFGDHENYITLFDNAFRDNIVDCVTNCSRGLHIRVDYEAMTAEVAAEYFHPMGLQSIAQGGMVSLKSGNSLIGWGTQAGITEHRGDDIVMDIQVGRIVNGWFPEWNAVYRAYKMDWTGTPDWDPSIAVEGRTVYLSWNGATELAGWVVLGSDGPDITDGQERILAESGRKGFETSILLEGEIPRFLGAAAIDSKGVTIGRTLVWDLEIATSSD